MLELSGKDVKKLFLLNSVCAQFKDTEDVLKGPYLTSRDESYRVQEVKTLGWTKAN